MENKILPGDKNLPGISKALTSEKILAKVRQSHKSSSAGISLSDKLLLSFISSLAFNTFLTCSKANT